MGDKGRDAHGICDDESAGFAVENEFRLAGQE